MSTKSADRDPAGKLLLPTGLEWCDGGGGEPREEIKRSRDLDMLKTSSILRRATIPEGFHFYDESHLGNDEAIQRETKHSPQFS